MVCLADHAGRQWTVRMIAKGVNSKSSRHYSLEEISDAVMDLSEVKTITQCASGRWMIADGRARRATRHHTTPSHVPLVKRVNQR
jgi:hypothetical protein